MTFLAAATSNRRFREPVILPQIVTTGLELYLDAGDATSYSGSGTTWFDLSGNSRDFTITGSPTHVSGSQGYFHLDDTGTGQTKWFSRTDANLPMGTGDFTITWWGLKTEVVENSYLFDFGTNGLAVSAGSEINSSWRYYNPTTGIGSTLYTSNGTPVVSTWYNITVIRSSATTTFYVNNSQTSSAGSDTENVTDTTLYLGRHGGNTNLNHIGYYAGFIMYHRALSTEERTQNHNAFSARYF